MQLTKLRNDCKEIKIEEDSRATFVLVKNLKAALQGKANVALQFLKAKKAVDDDYSFIQKKVRESKITRIKAKHNYISANNIVLTLKDEPSDEIPDENEKALELIRSPSVTRRFSNRFTQMGMAEGQNAVSRSSHFFVNSRKGNTVQAPPKSNLFVTFESTVVQVLSRKALTAQSETSAVIGC